MRPRMWDRILWWLGEHAADVPGVLRYDGIAPSGRRSTCPSPTRSRR